MSPRRLISVLGAAAVSTSLVLIAPAAEAANCDREVDDVKRPGPGLKEPVVLTPAEASDQRVVNFGSGRGTKEVGDIRINSDKRLPASVTPRRINFQALIERSGETLDSAGFPDPTFTDPRISADRKRVTFTVCMTADGVEAGKYVGGVAVSGPEGLGEARIGITANLKVNFLFWLLLALIAMGIAGGALYWKASTDGTEIDGGWWFKTVGALGVAFGALLTSYLNDPAWGAQLLNSGLALVGTALAAIGGRKLLE